MFKRLCLLLLISTSLLAASDFEGSSLSPSTPDQIAAFYGSNDLLIGGVISPLSGQIVSSKTDLVARGAQDVSLFRSYIPATVPAPLPPPGLVPQEAKGWMSETQWRDAIRNDRAAKLLYFERKYSYWKELQDNLIQSRTGWRAFPHHWLKAQGQPSKPDEYATVYLADSNGAVLAFSVSERDSFLADLPYGMSNGSDESPSGMNDPRNIRLLRSNHRYIVYCPDGTVRYYFPTGHSIHGRKKKVAYSEYYTLCIEKLPNGKTLRYFYGDDLENNKMDGFRLIRVESQDPKQSHIYSSISIDGSLVLGTNPILSITTNAGERAQYRQEARQCEDIVYDDKHPDGPRIHIKKDPIVFPPILTSVSSPFYRSELLGYDQFMQMESHSAREPPYSCTYSGSPRRVDSIQFPVGSNNSYLPLYKISYDPPIADKKEGQTTATRIDGSRIEYHFTPRFLPDSIRWFNPQGKLIKQKLIFWSDQQHLKRLEYRDGDDALLYAKNFECDSFGNPEVETFEGNLSGQGLQEQYTIRRKYSQDGRNLLLQEETDNGKVLVYQYLPETNLLAAKYTKDRSQILLREFYTYDDCYNLIGKISDDGESDSPDNLSGVTQRTITRLRLRQQHPFLHCPEWIEEYYCEGSQEKLLKKTHLHYDKIGHIEREEIYGSDDQFAYAITRVVDEQGNILSETNPLGQTTTGEFDSKGRPIRSVSFSGRLEKKMDYDLQGRLFKQEEIAKDGISHTALRKYNALSHCTDEIDYLGHSTHFEYDPITGKPTHIESPSIPSLETKSTPVVSSSLFDALGRINSKTDPNGHTTTTAYNAYGKPTQIIYPDGSTHKFIYYLDGKLKTSIDPLGVQTSYSYTPLDDISSKTIATPQGEILSQETYLYKARQLTQHTDPEGRVTSYFYDGGGRLIAEQKGTERTEWTYDSLNRIRSTKTVNGSLLAITEYDLLNRPIEERKEDLSQNLLSQVFYEYDADGNKSKITTWSEQQKVDEHFAYDSFHRLVRHEDSLGFATTTAYDENHSNNLGQRVLRKIETDPMGLQTIDTYDALGQIASTEKRTDQTLNLERFYRDASSNLTTQISDIYASNQLSRSVTTQWEYDSMNRKILLTEAFTKKTRYTYTLKGQLFQTIKPDGVILERTYDNLGHLKTLASSDLTCLYSYTHNRVGQLLELKDLFTQKSTSRTYDTHGRLIRETLANGLTVSNAYDDANRRTRLTLPDQSSIEYRYGPAHLLEVIRYDSNGNPILKNNSDFKYDALDRLVEVTSDDTHVHFTYDGLHRRLSKTTSTGSTNSNQLYLYDGQNEIGSFGATQELRILGTTPHAEIGATVAIELGQKLYVPLHDLSGNITFLYTPDGTFTESYRFTAFGEELVSSSINPWRFSSKRKDPETSLVYYGRRYYDPSLGRWLTPDPAGFTDGMNLYAFVHNDPLTHFDEYGLLDYGQYTWSAQDRSQGQLGLGYGLMNGAFNALSFSNALIHCPLAPFTSYQSGTFNWAMPSSYHTINSFLDKTHGQINNRFFGRADLSNDFFQSGRIGGELVGDRLFGGVNNRLMGAALNASTWTLGKLSSLRLNISDFVKKIQSRNFLQFGSKDYKSIPQAFNELKPTLERIEKGIKFPHRNDGSFFMNREGLLPKKHKEYYREYVHHTPGTNGPGPKRVVIGEQGEIYYTPDHYATFHKVK
ncbi:MAG: hypothetical protein JSS32_02360 [Verrucomicrobia bacterium]|nr:hypothetical protein [Verrucomicrobiota bacterium]